MLEALQANADFDIEAAAADKAINSVHASIIDLFPEEAFKDVAEAMATFVRTQLYTYALSL